MHRGILVGIGIILWIIGLFVPIATPASVYIPINYVLPVAGTIAFIPAIANRDK